MPDKTTAQFFAFFNEVGIISQLSRAAFDARLPDGLATAHFSVLNHLTRVQDGQTPLALARAFQVPKTTMTHTLAGLEAAGLVRTAPNPRDKRSKCVWLTEAGRAFREHAIRALEPDIARYAQQINPDLIAKITPMLTKVREKLDADRDRDPD